MQPIRSYIVRIYRRDRRLIAGVVEDVRTGRSTPFASFAALWAALTGGARDRAVDSEPGADASPDRKTP